MASTRIWQRMSYTALLAAYASAPSMAVPPPDETPPTTPPSFQAQVISASQINLSWGASTDNRGVTGYNIQRCQPGSCIGWVNLATTARTYSSTGLASGVTYTYNIVAVDAAGNESINNTVSAMTLDNVAPSAPSGFSASAASETQINLSWSAASDNVGVNGYAIEYCAGAGCSPVNALTTTSATGYSATGLSPATPYSFRVRAYDAQNNYGGYSGNASATTLDTTPPGAPSNLTAPSATGTSISLNWSAASDNVAIQYYEIEYCAGGSCPNFVGLATTAAISYTAGSLTSGVTYGFRVRARDTSNLTGGYSNTVSRATNDIVAPSTPGNFQASAASSGTQINLGWNASTDNVGIAGYVIDRCTGAGCTSWAQIGTTASTTFADSPLTPATTYGYRMRAYDAALNYSAEVTASAITPDTLAPSTPGTLTASASSTTQIDLGWGASTDNVGVSYYSIERCQGVSCLNYAEVTTTTATTFSNTGLTDTTTYNYRVRARDGALNWSGYTNIATASTPDGQPPSTPTGLVTAPQSGTAINLVWNASTDNIAVTGYAVDRCQGASCSNFAEIALSATTGFGDTGLVNGTTYNYRVRARDARGNWSTNSAVVPGTTNDTSPPTSPTSLVVTVGSSSQLNLSWTASTDNVGVALYAIERCQGASCNVFAEIGTSATISYSATGLTAGTTYRFQVRARDAAMRWSGYSNIAGQTTATDAQPPTAPSGLTATPTSATQINLSWTASTDNVGVTSYLVQRCTGAGCTGFVTVASPTTTSYNNTALAPSTTYRYQVRATDAVPNTSGPSNIVSGATQADGSAPSAPTIVITATTVTTVTMTLAATDNVGVTGYQLDRCTTAGCTSFLQVATPSSSPFTDTGRAPGTTYQYRARARDAAGNTSVNSASVPATTPADNSPPTTPGNLRSTGKTATSVSLAWDASTDNVGVVSYHIQRCTGAGCNSWAAVGSTTAATTTFTSNGLAQLTTYRFRVGARDGVPSTTYTLPLSVTTNDGQSPTSPGGLTLTVVPGQIALQWNASTDNVGVTAYLIERCNSASCTYAQIASVGTLTFADSTVGSGTNYSYRVAARDAQGNVSGYSTVGSALAADCD